MYFTHEDGALNLIYLQTEGACTDRRADKLTSATILHYLDAGPR